MSSLYHHAKSSGFPFSATTTTVSKEVGNRYWQVVHTNREGETIEYWARELALSYGDADGRNFPSFICNFVDF